MATKYVKPFASNPVTEVSGLRKAHAEKIDIVYGVIKKEEYTSGDTIVFELPGSRVIDGLFVAYGTTATSTMITPATNLDANIALTINGGVVKDISYVIRYVRDSKGREVKLVPSV